MELKVVLMSYIGAAWSVLGAFLRCRIGCSIFNALYVRTFLGVPGSYLWHLNVPSHSA